MAKINYYLNRGLGIWTDISDDGNNKLCLCFTPKVDGYIKVKDTVYRVKCGELTIPLSEIHDGICRLRLDTEGEGFSLECFSKHGSSVAMEKSEDTVIRRLLTESIKNNARLSHLEEKISVLLNRTEGHHIFN